MLGHRKSSSTKRTAEGQALLWLARKELSQADLRRKLRATGYRDTDIEQTLQACTARGWQSDQRCAESVLRAGLARGLGPQRIRYDLEQRDLPVEVIEHALGAHADQWSEVLQKVIDKRLRTSAGSAGADDRGRLIRFLQGRGFALDMILSLIKEMDLN